MARSTLHFSIQKSEDKPQSLEFRPEEQGYSVWINRLRRYEGQTFTRGEIHDRLYHIGRGYVVTTKEKGNEQFLLRTPEGDK